MKSLEQKIGYSFQNKELLKQALTHTSYTNEHKQSNKKTPARDNERLEFLGDSVLSLIVTSFLYENQNAMSEGKLSRLRATIVCEKSLRSAADLVSLGDYILLSRGEERTGGRNRDSIIADAMEAVIGAIYLDSGLEAARGFVMRHMETIIQLAMEGKLFSDYKTQFQEWAQKNGEACISYDVVSESGPDHRKSFVVALSLNGARVALGTGNSKKEAEQNAAKGALAIEKV